MGRAALAQAEEMGVAITVCVVDRGGNAILKARMDGRRLPERTVRRGQGLYLRWHRLRHS